MATAFDMHSISTFISRAAVRDRSAVDLWRDCEKIIPIALTEFYEGLRATAEYGAIVAADATVDRLKKAQTDHWRELFRTELPPDFPERSARIGAVHVKIDLPSGWYLAGYAFLLEKLIPHLVNRHRFSPKRLEATIHLLIERVFTDMILSNTAYENGVEADQSRRAARQSDILNLNNAARMIADANETAIDLGQLTKNTGRVSDNSQTIAGAASEMVSSVEEIARNSEAAAAEAIETDRTVGEGRAAVEAVASAIGNIASAVEETAASVDELSSASEQIGQILGVIEGIAGQTNLLALNATIEAARAGEAGRGFAVVAAEVKNLANQTARATEDINRRITALRSGMADILATMGRSNAAVDEGRHAIERAADTMNTVAGQVTSVTGKMREISGILGQQKQTSAGIATSIDDVAATASDNTAILREMMNKISTTNDRFAELTKTWFDPKSARSLCEMAKIDHVFFKKRVVDVITGRIQGRAGDLPDHHACRLGKWYDGIDDAEIRALPAYGRLVAPHERVHEHGRRAIAAYDAGRSDDAFHELERLNEASHEVLALLDELSQGIGGIELGAERRREVRRPTSEAATARIDGVDRPVVVLDRSNGGMRLEGLSEREIGRRVELTFNDGSCCAGHTRWSAGNQTGVRFEAIAAE